LDFSYKSQTFKEAKRSWYVGENLRVYHFYMGPNH